MVKRDWLGRARRQIGNNRERWNVLSNANAGTVTVTMTATATVRVVGGWCSSDVVDFVQVYTLQLFRLVAEAGQHVSPASVSKVHVDEPDVADLSLVLKNYCEDVVCIQAPTLQAHSLEPFPLDAMKHLFQWEKYRSIARNSKMDSTQISSRPEEIMEDAREL
jgi:hypothetical protein